MLNTHLLSSVRYDNFQSNRQLTYNDLHADNYPKLTQKINDLDTERANLMVYAIATHIAGIQMAIAYAKYNQNLAWTLFGITEVASFAFLQLIRRPKYQEINTVTQQLIKILDGDNHSWRVRLLANHKELLLKNKDYKEGYVANQIEQAIESLLSNNTQYV